MVFKRKIYDELLKWKNESNGKSAILVEGARRIGKSTIVEEFAKKEYDDYLLLNFSTENEMVRNNFFQNIGDLETFFRNLFLYKKKTAMKGKCVIIFDEVQLFPFARQSIKQLVADGRYDYIETGSLISIKQNVRDILIPSEEEGLTMFPMDFEEFLWACNDEVTYPTLKEAFMKRKPLGDGVHRTIMNRFRTYMAVGGMPQAVNDFVNNETYDVIDATKRKILRLYENDLEKYDEDNNEKATLVFKTLPEQLQNKNSHFKISRINKEARYKQYVDSISFISKAMIGNECINVTEPEIALEMFADRSNFKLYMGDTGLLVTQIMKNSRSSDENIYISLIGGKLSINEGILAENIVAQMLRASGHNLYFHEYFYKPEGTNEEKKYEIDFLTVSKKKICPIEVKSSGYSSHKSFDYLVKKYPIKMEDRYIIYTKDLKYEDGIMYIPLYMAGCIE